MSLAIIILAAGKGTRMKSAKPKVMHTLAGKPMLQHVIDTAKQLSPSQLAVVCGNGADEVVPFLQNQQIDVVMQHEQKGTGHAVEQAKASFANSEQVLVLYGDVPLITADTLQDLIESGDNNSLKVLTAILDDPTGYGRIVRDYDDNMLCITEEKDADEETKLINEINTGIMCIPAKWLTEALSQLDNNNAQGEYYLTDLIAKAVNQGIEINSVTCEDEMEVAGINNRVQLAEVESYYQQLKATDLMMSGVTFRDPARVDIRGDIKAGQDITIDINVIFEGNNTIADNVSIGAHCIIINSIIHEGAEILPNSIIENAEVGTNCSVGPFARLRPGTKLAAKAKVGNFVEVKNANIGLGSKINHLSYIGDTDMGADVNIGAGTITCNYDGANKHRTVIGDRVFVGSDTQLVAPVTVEDGATIGAGSTIRKTVPGDALTLTKSEQKTVKGWQRPVKKN
ncbi:MULTISPECIES: bifunctional UDP-N-acetylglucosamine diphosphorylase/glucosamine-1-phosphate N-acetyltransferase GlmU [unclassified Methylophaga]|jgi:bifunctional UDP-N-acetylglucosamine pyrophosphorylase/glucosamine-1-phosphate N-acetyltransferase|uniref:bifunctional UDP-N-acetylglucosamine diphosphorylase/glucosamine-1-phosphate N-acetyltransferase GlmU n=1 Tax=unclassified Methylophaga TaxID=2629249 RepID=UPI000C8CCEE2|nr:MULTISPECIES: bifunctional UDP-N-acetylglucosamine diphosphorylase/glucosamine-1-phosphate N-acetyltransferase GlmU [unclassified Methylophaga]MAP27528.1 UDP-N-acetylglucosamine diphosphorylase/glucosamine-1-phosphate N-acetyltransferase [Methylophaga sp.]HCO01243.1 UDP-N-acetylglucosamine diphosphorylase/glucosamine-1-phosphate N-acetyltransferase [Methylophaga sp.]|tara:strand:+ start:25057 stop:26421 length:1365 start_codon:yes stop_codon:yes gene_type:complete